MKRFAALFLAALAAAAPGDLAIRQAKGGSTANELEKGPCKGATFIWARGTMEPGNMVRHNPLQMQPGRAKLSQGWIIGNYLTSPLKKGLKNDIAVQGVKYSAGILTNIGPGMADPKGVAEAQRLFTLAVKKCPNTIVTGGGYSQGAAIMHRAIEKLPEDIKARIAAILLYGDTQFPVDGPKIKGFPPTKVKTICKPDDGVCKGMITVSAGHMSYSAKAAEGAAWVVEKVKAARRAPKAAPKAAPKPKAEKAPAKAPEKAPEKNPENAPEPEPEAAEE
jgi:cutinase